MKNMSSTHNVHATATSSTSSSSLYETMEERVFSTLHPIIHSLISSITNTIQSSKKSDDDRSSSIMNIMNIIEAYKFQSRQLLKLQSATHSLLLQSFTCKDNDNTTNTTNTTNDNTHIPGLVMPPNPSEHYQTQNLQSIYETITIPQFQQLIFAPSLLILQQSVNHGNSGDSGGEKKQTSSNRSSGSGSGSNNGDDAMRTHEFKCIEHAATTLQYFINLITLTLRNNSNSDSHSHSHSHNNRNINNEQCNAQGVKKDNNHDDDMQDIVHKLRNHLKLNNTNKNTSTYTYTSSRATHTTHNTILSTKVRMQIIHALHIAMGHVRMNMRSKDKDNNTRGRNRGGGGGGGDTKSQFTSSSTSSSTLDKGEYCMEALLSCMECILTIGDRGGGKCGGGSNSNENETKTESKTKTKTKTNSGTKMENDNDDDDDDDGKHRDDDNDNDDDDDDDNPSMKRNNNDDEMDDMDDDDENEEEEEEEQEREMELEYTYEFMNQMIQSLHGKFIPSLIMHCLSVFEEEEGEFQSQSQSSLSVSVSSSVRDNDNRSPSSSHHVNRNTTTGRRRRAQDHQQQKDHDRHQDIKGNVSLKLQSMRVIEILLSLSLGQHGHWKKKKSTSTSTSTSSSSSSSSSSNLSKADVKRRIQIKRERKDQERIYTDMWRSIFPGIFMTICRELLSHLRFSTSHSSPKLTIQAMKVLSILMNRTMTMEVVEGEEDVDVDVDVDVDHTYGRVSSSSPSPIFSNVAKELLSAATGSKRTLSSSSSQPHQSQCKASSSSSTSSSLLSLTPKQAQFFQHIRTILPSVLQLIFQLAPIHNKSLSVRHACVTYLVNSVLITTYPSWDMDLGMSMSMNLGMGTNLGDGPDVGSKGKGEEKDTDTDTDGEGEEEEEEEKKVKKSVSDLRIAALECIMTLMKSDRESLVTVCQDTLLRHKCAVGEDTWNTTTREEIVPRIVELMQRMPALARSGRESNLSSTMVLISGYVSVISHSMTMVVDGDGNGHDDGGVNERILSSKKRKMKRDVHSTYLANKLTSDDIRQCLVDIFVMDNKAIQQGGILHYASGGISSANVKVDCNNDKDHLVSNFRYMREKTAKIGYGMVRDIAKLIGFRRSMILVDSCIADIFESLSMRMNEGRSVVDGGHARWLEKYFGLVIVANETLKAFAKVRNPKRVKIVHSLTSSMISLICSDILWQLPSVHSWAGAMNASPMSEDTSVNHRAMFMLTDTQHLIPTSKAGIEAKGSFQQEEGRSALTSSQASTEALAGNGMLTIGLMNILVTLSTTLGGKFRVYIPTVIYPFIQKTNDLHSDLVRNNAYASLTHISISSCYSSTEDMMAANYSYLMETLVAELRAGGDGVSPTYADLQSQAICFYSLHNVMTLMMNNASKSIPIDDDPSSSSSVENTILLIVDMQASMSDWFTKQFQKSSRSLLQCIMVPMGLVKVFQGSVKYLNTVLELALEMSGGKGLGKEKGVSSEYFRWEDLLLEFKIDDDTSEQEKIPTSFDKAEDEMDENDLQCASISPLALQRLDMVLKKVLLVNSTILSLPDLKLQRLSCDLFAYAFELLSTAQHHAKRLDENDPIVTELGNPLSQSVSEYWPTLRIRFQTTTSSYIRSSSDDQIGAKRHLASLLSSILDVIATMGKLSGEMVASRFQDDIYPSIGKLFTHLLPEIHSSGAPMIFSNTDEIVLRSVLDALSDIFTSKEGKTLLGDIIPSAGSMILPLLSQDSSLGESAMNLMKLFLSIDSDCMWRSLLSLSDRDFPVCPLQFEFNSSECKYHERDGAIPSKESNHPLLRERANALMSFADALPEQPLLHI